MEQKKDNGNSWLEQIYNVIKSVSLKWHVIGLFALIFAVALDMYQTFHYIPQYRTEASVVMNWGGAQQTEDGELAQAFGYILSSNVFMDKIAADLEVKHVNGEYKVSMVPGTNLMNISAIADSPQVSYRMMYSMLNRYEEVTKLVIGNTKLEVIDKIEVPQVPFNTINHTRNLIVYGGVSACMLVALFAVLTFFRDTIKTRKDVKEKTQVRLLADIVEEPKLRFHRMKLVMKKGLLLTQMTTSFMFVESFKRLRARFVAQAEKNNYKVIVVNSTLENEGKTSIAVNLAIALAQQKKKVLLIDADLGKPALQKILEYKEEHSLLQVLKKEISMEEAIYHHERTNVDMVFAQVSAGNSSELLESSVLSDWLKENRDKYDYIIIDTPPASYNSDCMIVAQYADAVVMVIRQDYAPTAFINRIIGKYLNQNTPVIGAVLNRSIPLLRAKQYYLRGERTHGRE